MIDQDKRDPGKIVLEMMGGDVRVWVEQETIHLIAIDRPYGDPVELTAKMAMKLSSVLADLARRIDE